MLIFELRIYPGKLSDGRTVSQMYSLILRFNKKNIHEKKNKKCVITNLFYRRRKGHLNLKSALGYGFINYFCYICSYWKYTHFTSNRYASPFLILRSPAQRRYRERNAHL